MYLDDGVLKSAMFMMSPVVLNLEAIGYVRNKNMFACPVPLLLKDCPPSQGLSRELNNLMSPLLSMIGVYPRLPTRGETGPLLSGRRLLKSPSR